MTTGLSTPSAAATLSVTSAADDGGSGTLRSILAAAKSGDAVTFDPAVFSAAPQIITLTSGPLSVSQSLSLQGPGAGLLTISGGDAGRVLSVSGGPVGVSGLTLAHGNAVGNGGGVDITYTGSLALTNCIIRDNRAASAGGGIADEGGTLTVTNCIFTNNGAGSFSGGSGGGIYANGSVAVTNCTFTGNYAGYSFGAAVGFGGAVFADYGSVTVTNCILYGDASQADALSEIDSVGYGYVTLAVSHCDVADYTWAGKNGNISAFPQFIAAPYPGFVTDLHLREGSACIGAGTSAGAPASDLDGRSRPDPPSIGAFEQPNRLAVQTYAIQAVPGVAFDLPLATITDPSGDGYFDLSIDWGDKGEGFSAVLSGANGVFTLSRPHTYASAGFYTIRVVATDRRNNGATFTTTARVPGATSLSVPAASVLVGQPVYLRASLTSKIGGAGVIARAVAFTVDGKKAGAAATDGSGTATLFFTPPSGFALGSHTVTATFAADSIYGASSGTGKLTVTKKATSLRVSDTGGAIGQTITLSASFNGYYFDTGLSGKTLTFRVGGATVGAAVTNANGAAMLAYKILSTQASGAHILSVSFAGDAGSLPSAASGTLTVTKGLTQVVVPSVSVAAGKTVTLTAKLLRLPDMLAVSSRMLIFTVNGVAVAKAVTNSSGTASVSYRAGAAATDAALGVAFAGDGVYLASSGAGTLTVP